jgi:hypothetical protein
MTEHLMKIKASHYQRPLVIKRCLNQRCLPPNLKVKIETLTGEMQLPQIKTEILDQTTIAVLVEGATLVEVVADVN